MVAGTLSASGYHVGDDLISPNLSNPKGFFEDREINSINELLLDGVVPRRPPILGRWFFKNRPRRGANWMAQLPVGIKIQSSSAIVDRIRNAVSREPFCFKDPRFSYTLPAWKPYLRNTGFVCVFRDPATTASSIVKESREPKYARKIVLQFEDAVNLWACLYRHILEIHRHEGEWLFLHYNQVLEGKGLQQLESFLETKVDRSFPDSSLSRSVSTKEVNGKALRLYEDLCDLAGYR